MSTAHFSAFWLHAEKSTATPTLRSTCSISLSLSVSVHEYVCVCMNICLSFLNIGCLYQNGPRLSGRETGKTKWQSSHFYFSFFFLTLLRFPNRGKYGLYLVVYYSYSSSGQMGGSNLCYTIPRIKVILQLVITSLKLFNFYLFFYNFRFSHNFSLMKKKKKRNLMNNKIQFKEKEI